jgi:hypothetical protein
MAMVEAEKAESSWEADMTDIAGLRSLAEACVAARAKWKPTDYNSGDNENWLDLQFAMDKFAEESPAAVLAILSRLEAAEARVKEMEWKPTHRHKKSGNLYKVLNICSMKSSEEVFALREFVIYQGANGAGWVRPSADFYDGRFEALITQEPIP